MSLLTLAGSRSAVFLGELVVHPLQDGRIAHQVVLDELVDLGRIEVGRFLRRGGLILLQHIGDDAAHIGFADRRRRPDEQRAEAAGEKADQQDEGEAQARHDGSQNAGETGSRQDYQPDDKHGRARKIKFC